MVSKILPDLIFYCFYLIWLILLVSLVLRFAHKFKVRYKKKNLILLLLLLFCTGQTRPNVSGGELTRRFEWWQRGMQVFVAVILVCAALDGPPLS